MSYQTNKADHESFLAKKKAEILARKKQQTNKPSTNKEAKPTSSTSQPIPFANDGSFLEKFLAMQKANEKSKSSASSSSKESSRGNSTSDSSSSDYKYATELAKLVAQNGEDEEARARIEYSEDKRYKFLFAPQTEIAKFYRTEINRFKDQHLNTINVKIKKEPIFQNKPSTSTTNLNDVFERPTPDEPTTSNFAGNQPIKNESDSNQSFIKQEDSSLLSQQINPLDDFEKAKALMQAKARAMLAGNVSAVSEEEDKRKKEVEEQKMMNEIYAKVIAQQHAAELERSRKHKKNKYDYDSDEEVDGGTWEHKKRKMEMEKTKEWALDLTSSAKGKHHIADFLPPEELDKFMEKVTAVREGRDADFSDYSKYRIQSDNLGYKLLQKAGWQEGTGLGMKGEGIKEPINKGKASFDQSGIGTEKVAEVKKDDDDFELYRKRMMLAYKFRPNPLNNPRRPYYS